MEDTRRFEPKVCDQGSYLVLILVVVEDTRRYGRKDRGRRIPCVVLILVVVEDTRRSDYTYPDAHINHPS